MTEQEPHRYLHSRWRSATGEPITTDSRVKMFDEVTGDDGWCDVFWRNGFVRLGPVKDEYGEVIDPNPTFV